MPPILPASEAVSVGARTSEFHMLLNNQTDVERLVAVDRWIRIQGMVRSIGSATVDIVLDRLEFRPSRQGRLDALGSRYRVNTRNTNTASPSLDVRYLSICVDPPTIVPYMQCVGHAMTCLTQ